MKPKNGGRTSTVTTRTRRDWEENTLGHALGKKPERKKEFTTVSNLPIERLYALEDLKGWDPAGKLGFHTAFVTRPTEYGPGQTTDLAPSQSWDVVTDSFLDLATRLGC